MKIVNVFAALFFTTGELLASAASDAPENIELALTVINEDLPLADGEGNNKIAFATANAVGNYAISEDGDLPAPGQQKVLTIKGAIPLDMPLEFRYATNMGAIKRIDGSADLVACSFQGKENSFFFKPYLETERKFVATIKKADNEVGRVCNIEVAMTRIKRAR